MVDDQRARLHPQGTPGSSLSVFRVLVLTSRQVDLILPQECAEVVKQKLLEGRVPPRFSRVVMKLSDMLEGDFFKEYIKIGMGFRLNFRPDVY